MIKFSRTNYIGNEGGLNCSPGDIFQRDGNNFIYLENIFEALPSLDKGILINVGKLNEFSITQESRVKVFFNPQYGVRHISNSEARIHFTNKHSAFVHLQNVQTSSLSIGQIRKELYQYWRKRAYLDDVVNYCLVNTVMKSTKGRILYSKSSGTSVTLNHTQGGVINNLNGMIGGNVTISGQALSIGSISTTGRTAPIVQMVRFHKSKIKNKFRSV